MFPAFDRLGRRADAWRSGSTACSCASEGVLERVESLLPPPEPRRTGRGSIAARWRKPRRTRLPATPSPTRTAIDLAELSRSTRQKDASDRKHAPVVRGLPANNVLLTGSRGTGKSSLVKAMLADVRERRACG